MKSLIKIIIIFQLFVVTFFAAENCYAQGGISIIRDSETEDFLYDLTRPIFKAAGLNPDDIKIYIVDDSSINAFVSGGQNVFINTGLIVKYNKPEVLIGVLAHESGHIAAGHLARSSEEMENVGGAMILTYLAGIAAALAKPDAGMALIMGGNQIGQRLAMKFTRAQEESADSLALQYLNKMHYSPEGLLQLLQYFDREEANYKDQIDEYALTHPVSKKRINFIKAQMGKTKYNDSAIDTDLTPRLKRIVVKLEAFLGDPNKILAYYNNSQNPLDKYARTIAYFKKGRIKESLAELESLINLNPKDGYLWELKGQILFESGSIKDSVISYKNAVQFEKQNPTLARVALANSIIALNSKDPELINFAIDNLIIAKTKEPNDPGIFKALSNAYDQIDNQGQAYLSLANFNLLLGDEEKAIKYAKLAKDHLNKNDKPSLIQADDIIDTLKPDKNKSKEKK